MSVRSSMNRVHRSVSLALSVVFIVMGIPLLSMSPIQGCRSQFAHSSSPQEQVSSVLPEIEATEFDGIKLVPISGQGTNAIQGVRHIDINTYRLEVTGLVDHNLSLSYNDLLALPAVSEVVYMPCVEGWGYNAKWTGFKVKALLDKAGVRPEGTYVMFYTDEGYASGHPLSFLQEPDVILAYGDNDMTLTEEHGYPLRLVANNKYGYKWPKWIIKIVVMDHEEQGYWEQRGYSNAGDRTQ